MVLNMIVQSVYCILYTVNIQGGGIFLYYPIFISNKYSDNFNLKEHSSESFLQMFSKVQTIYASSHHFPNTNNIQPVIEGTAPPIVLQIFDSPNLSPPSLSDGQVMQYTAYSTERGEVG